MKHNISKYVVCPFYHSEEPQKLFCEGVQDRTSLHLAFQSHNDMREYTKTFCCDIDNYENCRIADMLILKHLKEGG